MLMMGALMMIMMLSGGLYLGVIAHSALQSYQMNRNLTLVGALI